jgi:hypothetical protein
MIEYSFGSEVSGQAAVSSPAAQERLTASTARADVCSDNVPLRLTMISCEYYETTDFAILPW